MSVKDSETGISHFKPATSTVIIKRAKGKIHLYPHNLTNQILIKTITNSLLAPSIPIFNVSQKTN